MKDKFLVEYRVEISTFLFIIFGLAAFLGVLGSITGNNPTGSLSVFKDLLTALDGWVSWLSLIGVVGFVVVLWWALDYVSKVRKFKELIDTESKAKFLKNMDEIEFVAWHLPKKYRAIVSQKKVELKITQ